jgi:hypothetical protein
MAINVLVKEPITIPKDRSMMNSIGDVNLNRLSDFVLFKSTPRSFFIIQNFASVFVFS